MQLESVERKLVGKKVLLINADCGIGPATARALAMNGADLAVTLSTEKAADPFLGATEPFGARVAIYPLQDSRPLVEYPRLIRSVVYDFGQIDIAIINCANRIEAQIDDDDLDEDAIRQQLLSNVCAPTALIRAAARSMNWGGRIVAIGASLADRVGTPGLADFASTQAALSAFCRGAAHDLGPRGITVNLVQLGPMDIPSQSRSAEILEAERASTALKRLGRPEEAAGAILFLVSPEAAFITGTTLNVDGGYNA